MKQPSLERLSHVIHATTSVCTVLYVVFLSVIFYDNARIRTLSNPNTNRYTAVGVLGYLYREGGTCGDILDNFENDDVMINVGRLALAITLGLSYPLLVLPCRDSLYRLIMMLTARYVHTVNTSTCPVRPSRDFKHWRRRHRRKT